MITTKTTYMPSTPEEKKLREVEELKKCNSYSSRQITNDPSALGKCVPSGGMPINGLESSTPVQVKVKEIALTDKVIKMAEGISQLNYQVREINSRLFRQEPNSGTISSGDPSCIDEYIHLISDGILEANEMLCNIVNKL